MNELSLSWDDIRLFLAVVEEGSFSAAARQLRVAQPTVSRRIADMEERLQEQLFERGAEGTTLTPLGERLVEPARCMAESAGELARLAERRNVSPEGSVRITASPGVAAEILTPFAARLRTQLPAIRLEVMATLNHLDIGRREADLALRPHEVTQRELVCVARLRADVGAFAAPAYQARLPARYGPADLDWIGWAPPLDHLSPNRELAVLIPGFRPVFASDDFLVQLRAAEEGLGVIVLGRTKQCLQRRRLVELDLDLSPYSGHLYLVCARSALAIPRIRAVAELLAEEIQTPDPPGRRIRHDE